MTQDFVTDNYRNGLRRVLGPFDTTCIVVGAIIGVGIFFTPSRVAALAGSSGVTLLVWAVGGLIALAGALTFAELGGLYPRTAGQYHILRDSFGPLTAFLFVFCNATCIQAGAISVIAMICVQHLWLACGIGEPQTLAILGGSTLLVVGLAVANGVGVKSGSGIQKVTVCAKVLTLLVVTCVALLSDGVAAPGLPDHLTGVSPEGVGLVGGFFAALVPALFSFGGWQHGLWIGGEVRRSDRNVPFGIIAGVLIVVSAYLLVNWAYLHLLGWSGVAGSDAPAADAMAVVWPGKAQRVVAAAVAISAFGVLNAQLLSGPRLVYGMASQGQFFSLFARVNVRFGTPIFAICLPAGTALILLYAAGADGVDKLLTGVVVVDGVFFVLTGVALILLRRKRPQVPRPVRVPGYPFVPLLFIVGEIGVVMGAFGDPKVRQAAIFGVAWIAAAAVTYFLFFHRSHRR